MGRARRLRGLLRPPVGGVHQHRVQQLPVPARAGSHVPGQRGADERRLVAAGSELSRSISTCRTGSCGPPARTGTYQIRDGTNVTRGADGTLNPIDPATGLPTRGNIAETFEFRAIDRNLQHAVRPAVQLRRAARARREHDARSALRRQQGHRAARGARVQPGLRPQLGGHAGPHLRAVQPGLRRRRQPQRRAERGRDRAGARRRHGRSDSRTPASAACSTTTWPTRPARSSASRRARRSSASTFRKPCCSATPDGRSTTRCSSTCRSGCRTACSSTSRTPTRGRRTPARPIPGSTAGGGKPDVPERRLRGAGQPARSRRELRAVGLRPAAPVQRQLGLGSAGPGRCSAASASRASCRCSRGCRTRSTRPSRSLATSASTAISFAVPAASIASGSAGRACAARSTSSASTGDDPDRGGVQQERALLADDGGGRISGQPGLRQPRPQRAARLLAAPRRPEPRQELPARRRRGTSSSAGTCSTCSTPSTTRFRTT